MTNEQREALIISGEIARLNGGKAAERLALAREIAAALLEARAEGLISSHSFERYPLDKADYDRLRAEAKALREGSHE